MALKEDFAASIAEFREEIINDPGLQAAIIAKVTPALTDLVNLIIANALTAVNEKLAAQESKDATHDALIAAVNDTFAAGIVAFKNDPPAPPPPPVEEPV